MLTRFQEEYRLKALDVDINGRWMPSAIFVRMQELAETHAELVGLGRTQIIEMGFAWVLTRMHLQMHHYPSLGQTIRVATWPLKPSSLLFRRQFQFEDLDGRILGRAASQWVVFDLGERVLRRTSVLGDYPYNPEAENVIGEPGKITLPDGMKEVFIRRVQYSDVDMNGHMNNSKYLNWICDIFPVAFVRQMHLSDIYINYVSEAHIGEDVAMYMLEDEAGFYVCGKSSGRTIFDAQTCWRENKEQTAWQRESAF